jgi:hypothetical protein
MTTSPAVSILFSRLILLFAIFSIRLVSNASILKNGSVVCFQSLVNCHEIQLYSGPSREQQLKSGSCILKNSQLYCYPTFMIIGMMKCGTGALMRALNQLHPLIKSGQGVGHTNEIHYFTRYRRNISLLSSMNAYLQYFPTYSLTGVLSSGILSYPMLFDKSPDYIRSREALAAVKEIFPYMKHIVLLRDPVSRAISGFDHNCRHRRYIRLGMNQELRLNASHTIPAESIVLSSQWGSYLDRARIAYNKLSYPCSTEDFQQYYLNDDGQLNWFNEEEASIGYYDLHMKNLLDL